MADPPINPSVPLTEEERQRLLAASAQPTIPSLYSIPPLPHTQEAKLMGGGTITPAAQRGMVPQVTAAPGTPEYGEQRQERVAYQNMFPWGTPQNHPGTWGKIGHVAGTIGNVFGQLAPGIAEAIPGSLQNRLMQERQAAGWTKLVAETQEKQAQTEADKSLIPFRQEEIKNLQSEEEARLHPKPAAEKEEEWKVVPGIQGPNGEPVQQESHSGQMRLATLGKVAEKPEKPDTANQDRERYEGIRQNQTLGKPVTPEDLAWAKAYEKAATLTPFATAVAQAPQKATERSDRSYKIQTDRLDKLRTPLMGTQNRIANLAESVNQNTPQGDTLIAPELLSILAGGPASGLRMTETEINRIVGGRSNWEALKAAANQWALDPKAALSVTPEQRREIRALYEAVNRRIGEQLKHLDDAEEKLNNTDDPNEMRKVMADANKQVTGVAQAEVGPPTGAGGGASQPRVQQNSKGEYRYSTDGGKTWQMGRPPNQ